MRAVRSVLHSGYVRQYVSLAASNGVTAVLSFAALVVLARTLSASELGAVVYAQAFAGLVFSVIDPRVDQTAIRFVPLLSREHGSAAAAWLYQCALAADLIIAAAGAVVLCGVAAIWGLPLSGPADDGLIALALLYASTQAPAGTAASGYALTGGLSRLGVLQAVSACLVTGGALLGLLAAGADGFLLGGAVVNGVAVLVLSLLAHRRIRRALGQARRHSLRGIPGLGEFTLKSSLATSADVALEQLPLAAIGARAGASTLASFRVAQAPGRFLLAGISPYNAIMFPRLSALAAEHELGEIRSLALSWTKAVIVPAAIVVGVSALVMPEILPFVFGDEYSGVATAASLLLAAACARATVSWSKVLPLAVGRPGFRLVLTATEAVALTAAVGLLAPSGVTAAAWGALAVTLAFCGTWLVALKALTPSTRVRD